MSIWDDARLGSRWKSTRRPKSKPLLVIEKSPTTSEPDTKPKNKQKPGKPWRFIGISNRDIIYDRFDERLEFESELLQAALDAGLDPNIHLQPQDIAEWMRSRSCVTRIALSHEKAWPHWNTPLHRALLIHDLKSVSLLLDHGADVNIRNALGKTPLHEAIILFPHSTKTVPLLISHGADVNAAVTPQKVVDPTPRRCREILSRGGVTPLHTTFASGSAALMRTLLQAGARVDVVSDDGWCLFDLVLLDQQWSALATLLSYGAKPPSAQIPYGGSKEVSQDTAQLAKKLLCYSSTRTLFPPAECLPIYHSILGQKECQDALIFTQSGPGQSEHFIHTFMSILRDVAHSPLPQTSKSFCASCLELQKQSEVLYDDQCLDAYSPLQVSIQDLYTKANGGCPLCGMIADQLSDNLGDHAPGMVESLVEISLTVKRNCEKLRLKLEVEGECSSLDRNILVTDIDESLIPDVCGPSSILKNDLHTGSSKAFTTAGYWLRTCKSGPGHEACQKALSKEPPPLPTRVINVGNETSSPFLFESQGLRDHYCALSYCRGETPTLKATKSNFEAFKKSMPLDQLPATIRDAVLSARVLGYRYLWVDILCIIQDDSDEYTRETCEIGNIYSCADLTISSLVSSDSNEGLFQPRQVFQPKPVPAPFLRLPKTLRRHEADQIISPTMFVLVPYGLAAKAPFRGTVHSCVWTMQEQALSTRTLFFGNGMLHWECLSVYATEANPVDHMRISAKDWDDYEPEYRLKQARFQRLGLRGMNFKSQSASKRDTLIQWQRFLSEYTTYRQLTHSSDRLRAVLGISSFVAPQLGSGLVSGLWNNHLLAESLCWVINTPDMIKRYERYEFQTRYSKQWLEPNSAIVARACDSPSWSWLSLPEAPITYNLVEGYKQKIPLISSVSFEDVKILNSRCYTAEAVRLVGTVGRVCKDTVGQHSTTRWEVRTFMDCSVEQDKGGGNGDDGKLWYLDVLGLGYERDVSININRWPTKVQLLMKRVDLKDENVFRRIGLRTIEGKAEWPIVWQWIGCKPFAGPDKQEKRTTLTLI